MEFKYKRSIKNDCPAVRLEESVSGLSDASDWLQQKASEHGLKFLLAHADDGLIWGKLKDNQLITSRDVLQQVASNDEINAALEVCPPLRLTTLQQARLFSEQAELFLWRDGDGVWQARTIKDAQDENLDWEEYFDEPQLLWGTHGYPLPEGFTLLRDGSQGLRHALPLPLELSEHGRVLGENGQSKRVRLTVRHYLNRDGFARVVASRLVGFDSFNEEETA